MDRQKREDSQNQRVMINLDTLVRLVVLVKLFKLLLDIYYIILPSGGIVHDTVVNTVPRLCPI